MLFELVERFGMLGWYAGACTAHSFVPEGAAHTDDIFILLDCSENSLLTSLSDSPQQSD